MSAPVFPSSKGNFFGSLFKRSVTPAPNAPRAASPPPASRSSPAPSSGRSTPSISTTSYSSAQSLGASSGVSSAVGPHGPIVRGLAGPRAGYSSARSTPAAQATAQVAAASEPSKLEIPKVTDIVVTGGPYHSTTLQVKVATVGGAIEDRAIIQWYRSVGEWWFSPIPGANRTKYQPVAEDLHCQIRVEYTPVNADGVRGPSVIGHVPPSFLMIDPAVASTVEQNIRSGGAVWDVMCMGEPRTIIATKDRVKIRKGERTKDKDSYNDYFQVVLHPTQPGMFTLHLNYRTKYECQTDSHITRDIIVLTLNSFFSLAVTLKKPSNKQPESRPLKDEGKGVQSVSEQQRDRIVPLEQIRAEASHKPHQQELTAMTDDSPRIVNIEITGGPFHTSPLQVHAEYRGGIEGASIIQWYRSQQNWFFTAIPNANQPIFQPTAEDVNTRIRVEYTPVRSDGVRGPTVVAMVPESFLVIDPRLTRAVEQNVMRGSATFELTVKNQPKEKRTLLLTHQGVEILKGDKLIVKARYQRIKTAVSVEDYTGFDLTFNSKIKYSFVVRDTIERDLIIFTIHTLGSLNAIAKKNMALASSMGFRTKEDGEVNVSKDGDKEVWGEWGKWTSYNKGHGAGPGQSTKGVDLEISEAFDDGEEDISGIIGWGASRDPGYGRGGGGGGSGGGVRGRGRGTMRGGGSVGGYGRGGVGRGGPGGPGDVVRGGLSTKDELAQLQGRGRGKEGAGATAGSTGPSGPRPGAGGAREPPKNPLFASRKTGGGKGGNPYSGAKLKEQMLNQPVFEAPVAGPDGIPPPPPPPPPGGDGGPPPPPPPPPGEEALPEREQKTKQLHWEKISRAALDKSVWRNATDAGVEIDDDLLAEMFKMEDAKALAAGRGGREEGGGEVQLRNRHQINIVIEGIKKPPEAIFEATLACRDSELDSAAWVQLNTFARKEEEDSKENILRLSSFSGDMSSLGRAEQLFAMLLRIPRLTSRFDAILFKLNLDLALPELHNKITVVTSACSQILNNAKFTRILEIILAFGNYLNFGTQRGFALGFRLDALRKLGDTRAVDKKTTLLHFLANFVAEREEELLLFGQEMPDVEKAAAISFLTLNADLDVLVRGLQNIEEEIAFLKENSSIAGDQFVSVMSQFLKHATNQIGELMKEATGMKEKTEKLAKYFAEDLSTFDPEGVFDILSSFIRDFQKAHKENLSAREKIMKAQEAQERALAGPSSSSSTASNRGGGAEAGLSSVKLKPVAPKPAAGATPMDFVLGVASSFSREAGDAEDGDDYYDDYDDDDIDDDDGLYLPDDAQARA